MMAHCILLNTADVARRNLEPRRQTLVASLSVGGRAALQAINLAGESAALFVSLFGFRLSQRVFLAGFRARPG
jgi:hypothetical protein